MTIPPETKSGVKRREFLKVLGATGAATTMVGCSSDAVENTEGVMRDTVAYSWQGTFKDEMSVWVKL